MYTHLMIRTQIYLDEDIHKDLTTLAKQAKEPMAKIARELLKDGIQKRKMLDRSGKEVLRKLLAVKAKGGPSDLSDNLDHYLYGRPKKT